MSRIKTLLDLYLKSSIHVALAVVSFTIITVIDQQIDYSIELLIFIFFSAITGYNLIKYSPVMLSKNELETHVSFAIKFITGLSTIGSVIFIFNLNQASIIIVLAMGFLSMLYTFPLPGSRQNLRSITGLKIILIATVWAFITVLLPLANANKPISPDSLILLFERFLFVIVLIIPFDIRDVRLDDQDLGTLPQLIGIRHTHFSGFSLLAIVLIIDLFRFSTTIQTFIPLLIISAITGILIYKSGVKQSKYFASFWVEAVPIFWLMLLLIFQVAG